MAVPVFFDSGSSDDGFGAISPAWPSGVLPGDVAFMLVETANEPVTLSTPAGFELVTEFGVGTAGATDATRLTLFWQRLETDSPTDPVIADAGDHAVADIHVFRGCVPFGEPWVGFTTASKAVPSSTTTFPDHVLTQPMSRVVLFGVDGSDYFVDHSSTYTNPDVEMTAVPSPGGSSGNGGYLAVAHGVAVGLHSSNETTTTPEDSTVDCTLTMELKNSNAPAYVLREALAGATTSLDVAWPADVLPGDVALLLVETANEPVTLSTPAGFELVTEFGVGTAGATDATRLALWGARADVSNPTDPVIADAGDHVIASMLVFRGCVNVGDPWAWVFSDTKATPSTSSSFPSAKVGPDGLVLLLEANGHDDSQSDFLTSPSNGTVGEFFNLLNQITSSGNGGGLAALACGAAAAETGVTTATVPDDADFVEATAALTLQGSTAPRFFKRGGADSSIGSISPDWPADVLPGDVAFMLVETANEPVTLTTSAGFELVTEFGFGTAGATDAVRLTLFWQRLETGNPTDPDIADAGHHVRAQIFVVRNCYPYGEPWVGFTTDAKSTPSTVTAFPEVAVQAPEALVLHFGVNGGGNAPTSFANSGLTQLTMFEHEGSAGCLFLVYGYGTGGIGVTSGSTLDDPEYVEALMTMVLKNNPPNVLPAKPQGVSMHRSTLY